jgi:hypothetical protein
MGISLHVTATNFLQESKIRKDWILYFNAPANCSTDVHKPLPLIYDLSSACTPAEKKKNKDNRLSEGGRGMPRLNTLHLIGSLHRRPAAAIQWPEHCPPVACGPS